MPKEEIKRINLVFVFNEGKLPFTYLGLPIGHVKLKCGDYDSLIEMMCSRIRSWSSRNISYAGRIKLVNAIVMVACSYCYQIFIMPHAIMHRINGICGSFLWSGYYVTSRACPISWERICLQKIYGGLGVRNIMKWNEAAIAKHVWAVAYKKYNIWVRWVHAFYIKDALVLLYPSHVC
ncbi:hypothetical protein RDABS01_038695 [Bienertia sinuspersici]